MLIGWLEMSVRREFPEKKVFYPREVEESRKLRSRAPKLGGSVERRRKPHKKDKKEKGAPALPSLKQTKGLELKERRSWRRKGAPAWETCSLKWWIS